MWLSLQMRVHNPAIRHSPGKFKFYNMTGFFQTHVSGGDVKTILVSNVSVIFILDDCKVSFLNYL